MNNEELSFQTAEKHLKTAEDNLRIGQNLAAFTFAIMSAEVALKSVLMSKGIFIDERPPGDKHHKIPKLFRKVKRENCLPPETIEDLESIVGNENRGGLGYIRIVTPTGDYIECTAGEYTLFRYIYKEASPYDLVKENDAKEKVDKARQFINILSPFFHKPD
jgi:HEPN domain-containing protein